MTETEFLRKVIHFLYLKKYGEMIYGYDYIQKEINNKCDKLIPEFLEQHSKEYYEVEFIKKEKENED